MLTCLVFIGTLSVKQQETIEKRSWSKESCQGGAHKEEARRYKSRDREDLGRKRTSGRGRGRKQKEAAESYRSRVREEGPGRKRAGEQRDVVRRGGGVGRWRKRREEKQWDPVRKSNDPTMTRWGIISIQTLLYQRSARKIMSKWLLMAFH